MPDSAPRTRTVDTLTRHSPNATNVAEEFGRTATPSRRDGVIESKRIRGTNTMNRYGVRAQEYWQTYLSNEYAQLTDPTAFFTTMGEQMSKEITTLSLALAGDDPGDEGYLEKVGRLNTALLRAEEQVMRETLPPTDDDRL
jgi:hypothetical protein